jgi:hypothetical protein
MSHRTPRRTAALLSLLGGLACESSPGQEPAPSPRQTEIVLPAASAANECGTSPLSPAKEREVEQKLSPRLAQQRLAATALAAPVGSINIPVFFWNVKRGPGLDRVADGHVTDGTFDATINKLNSDYAGTPFRFVKRRVHRVVNADWYMVDGSGPTAGDHERTMKMALRNGGANALNLYTNGNDSGGSSARYPAEYADIPWRDGALIHVDTFPRTDLDVTVEGDVVSHEVGHWLGLNHTFHPAGSFSSPDPSRCNTTGDLVDDTPAESAPNRTVCNATRDTCPSQPGFDPITNLMDYAPAGCRNQRAEFTAGQIARMDAQWFAYRQVSYMHLVGTNSDGRFWHTIRRPSGWTGFGDIEGQTGDIGSVSSAEARSVDGALFVSGIVGSTPFLTIRYDFKWLPFGTPLPDNGVVAMGMGRLNGDIHLCAMGVNRLLHGRRVAATGGFIGFGDVKSQTGDPGFPVAVDCAGVGNELHYAIATNDGSVKIAVRRADATWTTFQTVGTIAGVNDVDIDASGSTLQLVATTGSTQFHASKSGGGSWSGFGNLEGQTGDPGGTVLAGGATAEGADLHVTQVLLDGRVMHAMRFASGAWSSFGDVKAAVPGGAGAGAFRSVGLSNAGTD